MTREVTECYDICIELTRVNYSCLQLTSLDTARRQHLIDRQP